MRRQLFKMNRGLFEKSPGQPILPGLSHYSVPFFAGVWLLFILRHPKMAKGADAWAQGYHHYESILCSCFGIVSAQGALVLPNCPKWCKMVVIWVV